MRNHGPHDRPVDGSGRVDPAIPGGPAGDGSGLVFDFSDLDHMRVQDLSVLLTARQMASADDRTVWATGVEAQTWKALRAMGLKGYFKQFPTSDMEKA